MALTSPIHNWAALLIEYLTDLIDETLSDYMPKITGWNHDYSTYTYHGNNPYIEQGTRMREENGYYVIGDIYYPRFYYRIIGRLKDKSIVLAIIKMLERTVIDPNRMCPHPRDPRYDPVRIPLYAYLPSYVIKYLAPKHWFDLSKMTCPKTITSYDKIKKYNQLFWIHKLIQWRTLYGQGRLILMGGSYDGLLKLPVHLLKQISQL